MLQVRRKLQSGLGLLREKQMLLGRRLRLRQNAKVMQTKSRLFSAHAQHLNRLF